MRSTFQVNGKQYTPLAACPSEKCKENKSQGTAACHSHHTFLTLLFCCCCVGKLVPSTRACKFTRYQDIKLQELVVAAVHTHDYVVLTLHCCCAA